MILIPALLLIVGGILLPIVKPSYKIRTVYCTILTVLSSALTVFVMTTGGEWKLFSIADGLDISFAIDGLGKIVASVFCISWILVLIYSFVYIRHEGHDDRFYAFYMISLGMLILLSFASNLVTMYLCFECVTLMSMPLVLHSGSKEAVSAALKYLFYSIAGGFLGLFGIFFIYKYTGGVFVPGGALTGGDTMLSVAVFSAIIGFGTKAGMYPMHGWLPTAHPVAPAPASAVLSGIIAKAGIVAVVRIVFYSVGADFIRGTWVQTAWLILAMVTIIMGSTMAYREKLLKKRLAYSTVSNVSYIMLGLATLSASGFTGALLHTIAHAFAKNALFLAAGAVIFKTGRTNVPELRGIGKRMPVTLWCFAIASLSLIGIPPLLGFTSKWFLASAGASLEGVFGILAPLSLIISALLTAGYLLPPVIDGFFPGNDFSVEARDEAPASMTIPMIIFAFLSVAAGIFGGTLTGLITNVISVFTI